MCSIMHFHGALAAEDCGLNGSIQCHAVADIAETLPRVSAQMLPYQVKKPEACFLIFPGWKAKLLELCRFKALKEGSLLTGIIIPLFKAHKRRLERA